MGPEGRGGFSGEGGGGGTGAAGGVGVEVEVDAEGAECAAATGATLIGETWTDEILTAEASTGETVCAPFLVFGLHPLRARRMAPSKTKAIPRGIKF